MAEDLTKLAYVANLDSSNVSVFNISTNTLTKTISNIQNPFGVAVSPGGKNVYFTNRFGTNINKLDAATGTITPITVGTYPIGVALNPTGTRAYVTNYASNSVSVIDTTTNQNIATVPVGSSPIGVAVSPDGKKVIVCNDGGNTISIIDTATNIVSSVTVGTGPFGVAFNPSGTKAYVTNEWSNTVSVIDAATNAVIGSINVGTEPTGVAFTPNGNKAYITNWVSGTISVIDANNNIVLSTLSIGKAGEDNSKVSSNATKELHATAIPVGSYPEGVAVTPGGSNVYVVNEGSGSVSIINTATDTVVKTVSVGTRPYSLGKFTCPPASTPPVSASTIYGYSFTDINGNSAMDVGEQSLANLLITLKGYDTSTGTLVSKTTTTASNGYYTFTGINKGTYCVMQGFLVGWLPTSKAAYTFSVPSTATNIRKDFTNTKYT
jgi:YVTN family beta-propeller protein